MAGQPREFVPVDSIPGIVRDRVVIRGTTFLIDRPGDMVNSPGDLQPLVANTSLDKILAGLDILTMAKSRLRSTNYGRVLVEMSLVRLTRLDQLLGLGELLQTVEHGGASTAPTQTPSANTRPTSADEEKKKSMNQSRLARPR